MELFEKKCVACEGGVGALSVLESRTLLKKLQNWKMSNDHKKIAKIFQFKNYYQTMAFVNAVAWISHSENHHPDLLVGYNACRVSYTTHDTGGLTDKDFLCAAKVAALTKNPS